MIEIGKLTYAYKGRTVLKDASFKVNNGKIYGIFGLKASGKSTLLSLMAGAREAQEGVIRINGFDLRREPIPAKRCLGYCPQNASFYPSMTVYELLDLVAAAKAVREDRRFIAVHELMETYALEELRDRRLSRLTPAQAFRLKLAQALVGGSEIILLDAPTEGLSYSDAREARELIRELAEKGKTVFLATASAEEVAELAHEIMLLRNGSLSAPVTAEELLAEYRLLECSSEESLDETETALLDALGKGVTHTNDQTEEKEEEA